MENSTSFDLNQSIESWREELSRSSAFQPDDLEQLETHLRDSIARLQSNGLSEHEAFAVAKSRLGGNGDLEREFAKVNAGSVWLDRGLWMVIGSALIGAVYRIASATASLSAIAAHGLLPNDMLSGPVYLAVNYGTLLCLFLYIWKSGLRRAGLAWKLGDWLRKRPVFLAVLLVLVMGCGAAANAYMQISLPRSSWSRVFAYAGLGDACARLVVPIVLAVLLVRSKRHRAVLST